MATIGVMLIWIENKFKTLKWGTLLPAKTKKTDWANTSDKTQPNFNAVLTLLDNTNDFLNLLNFIVLRKKINSQEISDVLYYMRMLKYEIKDQILLFKSENKTDIANPNTIHKEINKILDLITNLKTLPIADIAIDGYDPSLIYRFISPTENKPPNNKEAAHAAASLPLMAAQVRNEALEQCLEEQSKYLAREIIKPLIKDPYCGLSTTPIPHQLACLNEQKKQMKSATYFLKAFNILKDIREHLIDSKKGPKALLAIDVYILEQIHQNKLNLPKIKDFQKPAPSSPNSVSSKELQKIEAWITVNLSKYIGHLENFLITQPKEHEQDLQFRKPSV
jgi:hypothetical protein